jgi:predicted MPP superfamily phosphohydrolase
MAIKVIFFLGAVLAVTIGAHLLFYKAVIRFFIITNPALKSALFTILILLSLSFMASFFLLQWQENPFSVSYYMFSVTWTGLFLNLLLAVLGAWIIIAAMRITGSDPNTRLIAAGCLVLAFLYSAYGMWNAFHPRTKNIEVHFKNLPSCWQNKMMVQLSDVHLGHFYRVDFLNNLVQRVNALNPDLIFITGDLFDGMAAEMSHFATGLDQFSANKGVFFVTGNHETYIGLRRALNTLKETNIRILQNEAIEIDGLQIIGISYPGIRDVQEIAGLEKLPTSQSDSQPRILLFHTPTNISPRGADERDYHFATYWLPDTTFALAKRMKVDLQLSGHSHAGQLFPFGYLTKLIYKGFDYGLHRSNGFSIYITSGVGTWGPPMRTGNFPEIVVINMKGF